MQSRSYFSALSPVRLVKELAALTEVALVEETVPLALVAKIMTVSGQVSQRLHMSYIG